MYINIIYYTYKYVYIYIKNITKYKCRYKYKHVFTDLRYIKRVCDWVLMYHAVGKPIDMGCTGRRCLGVSHEGRNLEVSPTKRWLTQHRKKNMQRYYGMSSSLTNIESGQKWRKQHSNYRRWYMDFWWFLSILGLDCQWVTKLMFTSIVYSNDF